MPLMSGCSRPAFLAEPRVHRASRAARKVYLPAGTRWYDFYSGEVRDGGQALDAAAPLARMPLFHESRIDRADRAPAIQIHERAAERTDHDLMYQGADGSHLYEDDGVTYGYERGVLAHSDHRHHAKRRGRRSAPDGTYPGMPATRTFGVRWIALQVTQQPRRACRRDLGILSKPIRFPRGVSAMMRSYYGAAAMAAVLTMSAGCAEKEAARASATPVPQRGVAHPQQWPSAKSTGLVDADGKIHHRSHGEDDASNT